MGSVEELVKELEAFAASTTAGAGLQDNPSLPPLHEQKEAAQQVAEELIALQSIFGEDNVQLLQLRRPTDAIAHSRPQKPASDTETSESWDPEVTIRLCIAFQIDAEIPDSDEPPLVRLSATLPPSYPIDEHAPQLQLLNRYIGAHGVDHSLFGCVLRVFMEGAGADDSRQGLWQPGNVALFDGIEKVRELVQSWYEEREGERVARRLADDSHRSQSITSFDPDDKREDEADSAMDVGTGEPERQKFEIISSPPIAERKSVFVGHVARIKDSSQVPLIIEQLLQDRKIARATHPVIHAWVCKPDGGGTVHRDCDDDGETAAGGRLAHLLDLLHLENVVVVVTRWYGGVQLGADRFKLINRAARDALEVARLVDGPLNPSEEAQRGISKKQQTSRR
ncbi:UPF0029-domain-containing protein [Acaromyces ingoldii]|uniref:UPF0029-domain-containing protein n=1 Tax=Acaromyces ingoldii TaxID=215250 RepID=A0A316YLB8_9BASI|nr:UPF0029-domain-containing protein [Acaromyces ingoldii]PWN90360.1 UPF0029-domain-containing protein [Acaromyces ingoldii]